MSWQLRPAVAADADALALVAAATFLQTYAGVLAGEDLVAHCRERLSRAAFADLLAGPGWVMLAEHGEGGAPVGYAVTVPSDLPVARPGDVELLRLYALAAFHGTGLGAALMDDAARAARAAGRSRLLLGVYHGNARARRFYERQGFTIVGERPFRVGATTYLDPVYALAL